MRTTAADKELYTHVRAHRFAQESDFQLTAIRNYVLTEGVLNTESIGVINPLNLGLKQ